ncbi:MAG: type VI secretion system baseplate subunit TssG [Pseudomonadota bacterium]
MAPRDGSGEAHLSHLARLRAAPEKHHIFHALRLIEAAHRDAPRHGRSRRPREEPMRFGQEAELSFPPSSIASYEAPEAGKPGRLINRFFGLFGPHGPLPLHLTEYARSRQRQHRDPTIVAFAEMLTHRLLTLLYRAWLSGQPAPSFDRADNDDFQRKVAAIQGRLGFGLDARDAFDDVAKRHFAGLLAQGPKNTEGLVSILRAFFGARVELQPFIGTWLELEPDDQWQLGAPVGLGQTTSIGSRVWSRSAKFRLRIGPLSREDYERLLPGGASLERLKSIVRNYVGDSLDWDVNLVLKREEIPKAELGNGTRLGQISWVGSSDDSKDADDLFLEPGLWAATAQKESKEDL